MMELFNAILARCSALPKDFTYVGIGSAPHDPPEKITALWDQVLPVFIMELLNTTDKTLRAIHFDPAFSIDAMTDYFKMKLPDLSLTTDSYHWIWSNSRIEIIISREPIYHHSKYTDDPLSNDNFLKKITYHVLETNGQLVVQEFSGRELTDTLKNIYSELSPDQKRLFKKRILFDITYGEACHCMTDMTKYKPLKMSNGDFYNFLLYSRDEMNSIIGHSKKTDAIIYHYFYKEYAEILDGLHLIYRRNTNKADNATDEDPDEVMALLQRKLTELLPIFKALDTFSAEKEASLKLLFTTYREHNMYKWYTAVKDHLRPFAH